jgi:hypothetical protein
MIASAANLAQFYVGTPEDEMIDTLYAVEADVENGLRSLLGADVAALVAETFCATVIRHRRELEALRQLEAGGSMSPPVLN